MDANNVNTIGTGAEAAGLLAITGMLFVLLGLPMALGKVRRNWLYGVRTTTSMASATNWTAMNKAAGRVLVCWGVVLLALAGVVTLLDAGTERRALYTGIAAVPLLLSAAHLIVAAARAGRTLRSKGSSSSSG